MTVKIKTMVSRKTTIILASILLIACVAVATFIFSPLHSTKAASSCGYTAPTLSYGSTGSWVQGLQQELNTGYQKNLFPNSPYNFHPLLQVDGIFGSNTQAAVMDFQAKYKSQVKYVDGIVGTLTYAALNNVIGGGCTSLQ